MRRELTFLHLSWTKKVCFLVILQAFVYSFSIDPSFPESPFLFLSISYFPSSRPSCANRASVTCQPQRKWDWFKLGAFGKGRFHEACSWLFQHLVKYLCIQWQLVWIAQEASQKDHLTLGNFRLTFTLLISNKRVPWFNLWV